MSDEAARPDPDPPPKPARLWGRDLRLVLATAGFTSLFWLILAAFAGVNLLRSSSGDDVGVAPDRSAVGEGEATAPTVAEAMPAPESGPMVPVARLRVPVEGVGPGDLIDSYNDRRGNRPHEAIDIMAPAGSRVIAAMAGKVEKLFLSEAGGKTIYVRSPSGTQMFYYAHLASYAPGLAEGDFVHAGQVIGTVGSSGNADPAAPHLHLAVMRMEPDEPWWKGTPVNPYPLLRQADTP